MQSECGGDQFSVANLIHNNAADDDTKTKTGEARAANEADLAVGKSKESFPFSGETVAQCETDAGGQDGHKAGPKKALRIGSDRRVIYILITHRI